MSGSASTSRRSVRREPTGAQLRRELLKSLLAASPAMKSEAPRRRIRALAEVAPEHFTDWWDARGEHPDGLVDVIDFFSGCGGMSAGFAAINGLGPAFRLVAAVDVDTIANRTYEHNLGLSPFAADVHALRSQRGLLSKTFAGVERRPDHPLVVIGCAPCQGFSSHRNGIGDSDGRNGLFEDFAALALRLKPDFIVIENVPELCTDRYWPRVMRVREQLQKARYRVHLAVHNMAEFGLPQERFRAVMIAAHQNFDAPGGFVGRDRFRTVRDAIGALPRVGPGVADPGDPLHRSADHRQSTIDMIQSVPRDGGRRRFDSGPAGLLSLQKRQGKPAFEDVYGRLYWDRPAITITHYARNPASGRFVHPEQDRGLTGREAALLQGFPLNYEFLGGFDDRFRQIGNAVPPVVAAHLALVILGSLLDPPTEGPLPGVTAPLAKSVARLIPALKARSKAATSIPADPP